MMMTNEKDMYKKILESLQMAVRDKLFDEPDDMNPMAKDGEEGRPEVVEEIEAAQKEPPAFAAEEEESEDGAPSQDLIKSFLEGKMEKERPMMKGLKVGKTEVEVEPVLKKRGVKKGY